MTIGLIICGALGKEVKALIERNNWDAEMIGVKADDHIFPEKIAPDVEARILENQGKYEHLIVVFGDCGTVGGLDRMLEKYPDIERVAGLHCYDFYSGDQYQSIVAQEPGTYILTDFMVRTFYGLILKSMGLDRYPQLKKQYFKNYKRIIYMMQIEDPKYIEKANTISEYLELPMEIQYTGLDIFEKKLGALIDKYTAK